VVSGSGVTRRVLRAAITGYYPGSLDRARADAERRAMLAALRAADGDGAGPCSEPGTR